MKKANMARGCSMSRGSRVLATRHASIALMVLLMAAVALAACESSSSPSVSAGGTATPGASSTSTTATGATATTGAPAATAAAGSGRLDGTLNEQFTADYCTKSSGQPAGSICFSGSGSGHLQALGNTTFTRTAVYLPAGSNSCSAAKTQGTLMTGSGDRVTFTASGTFCGATQTATYTYTITGGSGPYTGATGTGTITVPRPQTSSSESQNWSGTLTLKGA